MQMIDLNATTPPSPTRTGSRSFSLGLADDRPQLLKGSWEQLDVENMTWFTKYFVYPVKKMNQEQPKVCKMHHKPLHYCTDMVMWFLCVGVVTRFDAFRSILTFFSFLSCLMSLELSMGHL
jgi:hypothetical protein